MNMPLPAWLSDNGFEDLSDWPRPLAYMLAAMLCAFLGSSESLAQRTQGQVQRLWLRLCPLYLLVASNCLVQGDVLWLQWVRSFAREQHAYEERRFFQLASLLVLVLLAAAAWKRHQLTHSHAARANFQRTLLLAGASGTLLVYLLRYVSFHYTDLALNAIWLDHSVASWVEAASLGLAAAGTSVEVLRSYGHV